MKHSVFVLVFLVLISCRKNEARRPKSHTTQNFYKEVLEHNKRLNKIEDRNIELLLTKDTINNYQTSNNGFWYTYIAKDTLGNKAPKLDDIVTIKYDIKDVFDNVIYEAKEVEYKVGKENLIAGIADGVQLMKKGEEMIFIIPSYRAFGVTGDGDKIKMNKTLKTKIKLIDIKQKKNENK